MRKFVVYENSSCLLDRVDMETINTLLDMSQQIKENLGLPYQPIRFDSGSQIFVERIIGNISQNDVNLVILPKVLDKNHSDETERLDTVKSFLLRTLKCIGDKINSTVFFTKSNLVDDQGVFIEVLARYFYEALFKAIKLGTITTYETVEKKTSAVKGRILVHKQLSEPMCDPKIWCRYKKISNDNSYNQLLLWACKYFVSAVHDLQLKKQLNALVQEFDVTEDELTIQVVSGLHLPRQFGMYKESFSIAQNLFLRHSGKKENGLGNHVCGYVISTERAFESIVECYCKKAATLLGYAHRAQATTQLAKASVGKEYDYYIIPDDLVFTKEKRLVVDAKYKLLKHDTSRNKPLREDFYQMISSCIAQNAYEAVLVYPKTTGYIPISWKVIEKLNGKNYIIRSAFVDIFGTDESVLQDMTKILMNTAFHGVAI